MGMSTRLHHQQQPEAPTPPCRSFIAAREQEPMVSSPLTVLTTLQGESQAVPPTTTPHPPPLFPPSPFMKANGLISSDSAKTAPADAPSAPGIGLACQGMMLFLLCFVWTLVFTGAFDVDSVAEWQMFAALCEAMLSSSSHLLLPQLSTKQRQVPVFVGINGPPGPP